MLLEISSHSQFRIGICISMIILLLGVVSIYTIKTMDDINQNYNFILDYNEKISNFDDIKVKYERQMTIFESLKSEENLVGVGTFWIYNTEIKNKIYDFNRLILDNHQIDEILANEQFFELENTVNLYYNLHLEYENSASNALSYFYDGNFGGFLLEYENLKYLQFELLEKLQDIEQMLEIIPVHSKLSVDEIIVDFQILQWTMIILVGVVTSMLVFFLNQTNKNLKNEIKTQTKDLQKLNEKLKKVDKKREEFISIASHELKGPIQPIFGFVELAKTGIISKQEALEGISNIALNLENIANNVLDLTKIENDELELHLEKNNINDIISEVLDSEHFNPDRKVPIKTRLDLDVMINLDKTRIKQVLRNIIDNCIKFTETGDITIQTNLLKDKKTLKLFISDSGPEIPNDVLPKIFKKFVTKGNYKISGFGLGLYISKKIIDAHNGKISAYNKNGHPVFEIALPIVDFDLTWKDSVVDDIENSIKNN
ncbi:HAMP domain-containing sensor histidine kinase [Nitrosopumilus sp. b3]|uniref:sensor histidine kinase n=1 Tax=Nitrosopumilus sp. b3 TaxID=2109909 RepID=UPI00210651C4|nr:HAMP domain-containing sensor histidine kinase [Nitrosopumilus sp. b3]